MRFDRPTFVSLLVGHLIFLVLAPVFAPIGGYIVTPAYVLPMLIVRRRSGALIREIIVFAVLMTGVHFLAIIEAMGFISPFSGQGADGASEWLAGATGGLIGSAATLALIVLFRLAPFDRRTLALSLGGVMVLTALGSVGVVIGLAAMESADGFLSNLLFCLPVYTPWQVALAALLATLLRPARPVSEEPSVA